MDEDISIINSNTRVEKIKKLFLNNKKKLLILLIIIIMTMISFFGYGEFKKIQKTEISDLYYYTIINYENENKDKTKEALLKIIEKKDSTYSPLSLYFVLDNELIQNKEQINGLFDILIDKTYLEKEIKNLVIYKKALFNADSISENELLNILNPIIKSKSIWNSHALYLLAEFFYSKNEKQKSKEFFDQIINSENSNPDILVEAQKRINRDLSD